MIRNILSVIAGYIAMAISMMVLFTLLYLVLGADGSFKPGAYDVSNRWALASIILGFLAVMIGGYVAVMIARNSKAALWLGVVVLLVSLLVACIKYTQGNPHEVRTGIVLNMQAMNHAQNPTWFNFLVPFTGFFGALIGGNLRKNGRRY